MRDSLGVYAGRSGAYTRAYRGAPLAGYTTFGLGGPAALLVRTNLLSEVKSRLKAGTVFTLGGGSNLLVSDKGYDGVVLRPEFTGIEEADGLLLAGAGVRLSRLCGRAAEWGLSGLEWACRIPGTVGGAVKMNAGAHGGCTADALVYVDVVLPDGAFLRLGKQELDFSYRRLNFDGTVVGAAFKLTTSVRERVLAAQRAFSAARKAAQPSGRSAGSVFKAAGGVPAYKYVLGAGMGDAKEGGAEVSQKHANFIINSSGASSRDVYTLMKRIQERVEAVYGIRLEPEIITVGEF